MEDNGKRETTIWVLIQSKSILDRLVEIPFDAGITFNLIEIIEKINKTLSNYQKTLQTLLKKHKTDEKILNEPNSNPKVYGELMEDLTPVLNKRIKFDSVELNKDTLKKDIKSSKIKFSVNEFLQVKWLYTPVEDETQETPEEKEEVKEGVVVEEVN